LNFFKNFFIINLGDEMTRLEELEEQARHLKDKIRTKQRKLEDMKNDFKVISDIPGRSIRVGSGQEIFGTWK